MFVQKLEIEPIEKFSEGAIVKVDGVELHNVSGYTIEHNACEIAECELRFNSNFNFVNSAFVSIGQMEDMARVMDKEQFEEFCKIWKEIHEV